MTTQRFIKHSKINAPADEVYSWHARSGAIERLSPPFAPIRLISKTPGVEAGTKVHMKIKTGPVFSTWRAEHSESVPGKRFTDVQRQGPFKAWQHTHEFTPIDDVTCTLEDRIDFQLPAPFSSLGPANAFIRRDLERIFRYRHTITQRDLTFHRSGTLKPGMKIAITGATGAIGSFLIPFLTTGGHDVYRLVRRKPIPEANEIFWDPVSGYIDEQALEGCDVLIHLAGENIGEGIWTPEKKRRIIESRTLGTRLVAEALTRMKQPPGVFLSASATGFYGETGEHVTDESSHSGNLFISEVCRLWESAAAPAVDHGIRTVFMRIGVVLTPSGGALSRLLPFFKAGLGATIGSGRQFMSWISPEDIIGSICHLIATPSISGPVNLVSPEPLSNLDFTTVLGDVLKRPTLFSIPERLIRKQFGRMGEEVLLTGTRSVPSRLIRTGYRFHHTDILSALSEILGA